MAYLTWREVEARVRSTYGMERTPETVVAELHEMYKLLRRINPKDKRSRKLILRRANTLKNSSTYGEYIKANNFRLLKFHLVNEGTSAACELIEMLEEPGASWDEINLAREHIGWDPFSKSQLRKWSPRGRFGLKRPSWWRNA